MHIPCCLSITTTLCLHLLPFPIVFWAFISRSLLVMWAMYKIPPLVWWHGFYVYGYICIKDMVEIWKESSVINFLSSSFLVWTKSSLGFISFLLALGSFCCWQRGNKNSCRMEMRWVLVALKHWCRFLLFGVYVGCKMMVWSGSCQGRCAWRRSRGAATEGFVAEKIRLQVFCFGVAEVVGMRFVDLCLEGKYKNNPLCNVFREAEYLSKNWVWWLRKGNDEKF